MMQHTIHFLPDNINVKAETGDNLLSVAAGAGIFIRASCGGDGVCRKCKVELVEGELQTTSNLSLHEEERAAGIHLACVSTIVGDATVRIPEILLEDGKALKSKPKTTRSISAKSMEGLIGSWRVDPPVRKVFMQLPSPTIDDNIPDMQRLMREYHRLQPTKQEPEFDHPEFVLELADTLRESDWQVTIIILEGKHENDRERIIAVEPGDTRAHLYGLAIDIGTTTMSGVLIDLNSGRIIAEASRYNRQISCGEDVIARMIYASRPSGLKNLQKEAVKTINGIIEEVCRDVIINPSDISFIMAAGNTVMTHLLLGISPKYIRQAPYVPKFWLTPLSASFSIPASPPMWAGILLRVFMPVKCISAKR